MGKALVEFQLPLLDSDCVLMKEPIAILNRRIIKRRNQAVIEVLIQWKNIFPEDSTWETFQEFQERFPEFHP